MNGPWRDPDEETVGLYPGLVVHDGRQSGSITAGPTRLPLWAFVPAAVVSGWDVAEDGWSPSDYGWTGDRTAEFVHDLLNLRGEFARLLLVLANEERIDSRRVMRAAAWWHRRAARRRVAAQLRRCLAVVEEP